MKPTLTAVLACHPETPSPAVYRIEARVCWTGDETIALTYALKGDLARLRIPPPRSPRQVDGLWRHTCFEAFVGGKGESAYLEFNFSPSREWAVYSFRGYRDSGLVSDQEPGPEITVRSQADGLELDALVKLDHLGEIQARGSLRLALSAVIEDNARMLSYWALKHPPGKPDFHHPDAFAREIECAGIAARSESPKEKL
jgi:hypothetical protein